MMRDKGASGPEFVSLEACWSHGPGDSHVHLAAALPAHTCPPGRTPGRCGGRCQGAQVSVCLPASFREAPRRGGMTSLMSAPAPCVIPRPADLADFFRIGWKGGPRNPHDVQDASGLADGGLSS